MRLPSLLLISAGLLAGFAPLAADIRMPGLFGDHMVLQQDVKIPVWGWAEPGEKVSVTFGAATATTTTGADGKWRVDLEKTPASKTPQTLTVAGANTLTFTDVLVGDVWLCSGQSNMEFGILNISKDETLPEEIRIFHVTKAASLTPLDDTQFVPADVGRGTLSGHWQKTFAAGSWGGFSAVGSLFAKEIHAKTGRPIGMIGSYWGGTPAQAWTDLHTLKNTPALTRYADGLAKMTDEQKAKFPVVWADYMREAIKWEREVWGGTENYGRTLGEWQKAAKLAADAGTPPPPTPEPSRPQARNPGNVGTATSLYNGMIHPLLSFPIKGVIWYQGESNSNGGRAYAPLFIAMIESWRRNWNQPELPFIFVQVAGYGPGPTDPSRGHWADLRQGQADALVLPRTGMATAIDVGDEKDIHPRNKFAVAHRLALLARQQVYGENIMASGPAYERMTVEPGRIRIAFKNTGGGLVLSAPPVAPGLPPLPATAALTGFEIAGSDKKWTAATAVIDGTTVVVSSPDVPAPVAVRYAWADFPACSLYNADGLPAFPFCTEN